MSNQLSEKIRDYDGGDCGPGLEPNEKGEIAPIPEITAPLVTPRKGWVSLENRRDLWPKYMETLTRTGRLSAAATAVGTTRKTAFLLRQSSQEFSDLCDEALARYQSTLEAEAMRRAVHGVEVPIYHQGVQVGTQRKYSDRLLELALKTKVADYREAAKSQATQVNVSATAEATQVLGGIDVAKLSPAQREAFGAFLATLDDPTKKAIDAACVERPMLDAAAEEIAAPVDASESDSDEG
jgi:hypothetical protein